MGARAYVPGLAAGRRGWVLSEGRKCMTLLVAWLAVDSQRPSALYLAADSRLTDSSTRWDAGQKVFALESSQDVLGYCGNVALAIHLVAQAAMTASAVFDLRNEPDGRRRITLVHGLLGQMAASYPRPWLDRGSIILMGSRTGHGTDCFFDLGVMNFVGGAAGYRLTFPKLPDTSGLIASYGSGAGLFTKHHSEWKKSAIGDTSRAVFGAFRDAAATEEDPLVGGPPQIVMLRRVGMGHPIGYVSQGRASLGGTSLARVSVGAKLEWRNQDFERVDQQGVRLRDAQRQPRPKLR